MCVCCVYAVYVGVAAASAVLLTCTVAAGNNFAYYPLRVGNNLPTLNLSRNTITTAALPGVICVIIYSVVIIATIE